MAANRIVVSLIDGWKDITFGRTVIIDCLDIIWKEVGQPELKTRLDLFLNSHDIRIDPHA